MDQPPPEFLGLLRQAGLAGKDEAPSWRPLTGGVSSDIWLAETARGPVCLKRALAKLKVEADWFAPVERNAYEVDWMKIANRLAPGAAPEVLAHDPARGLFAMAYLDPVQYRPWKEELRRGRADPAFAGKVGATLARIHAGTAGDTKIARRFATDTIFRDIRLEPYLEATGRRHPDRAEALSSLVAVTAATRRALVHGDVSPKNILVGPDGPVFLDAECAWYGDPAFDLAFCLNHFLLKCLWTPAARDGFLACFAAMAGAYLEGVGWEPAGDVEARAAHLLPGLFLGRVDGKSPVEYLSDEGDKDKVRCCARRLLAAPAESLAAVAAAWQEELEA